MIRRWPLIFVIIPLIELYVIIAVGERIGAFWTIMLVLLTAVVGVNLLRVQGVKTLMRAQANMARGQVPAMEMMEGMVLAAAGIMLITPGFISDTLGFLCLIPTSRQAIIRFILSRSTVQTSFDAGSGGFQPPPPSDTEADPAGSDQADPDQIKKGRTIEGEFRRED